MVKIHFNKPTPGNEKLQMVKIHSYNFNKPTPKNKKSTLMVKIHSQNSKFIEPLLQIKNQLQMVKNT